jgi:hypothetical protein
MAIIFELWAECNNTEEIHQLRDHFTDFECTLQAGLHILFQAELVEQHPHTPGLRVWSPHLSRHGISSVEDAVKMSEAGLYLYHHLLTAPNFLFARVAIEAENIPMRELSDYISTYPDGQRDLGLSCVILLKQMKGVEGFRKFRVGYSWTNYRGEAYYPLNSCDNVFLSRLRSGLFAI